MFAAIFIAIVVALAVLSAAVIPHSSETPRSATMRRLRRTCFTVTVDGATVIMRFDSIEVVDIID